MELEKLKQLTGESDETVLSSLLLRAENIILSETNREKLTPALKRLLPELAIELYNRSGSEGEQSRSEGGISVTYSESGLSTGLLQRIRMHRLARVAGHVFEKE
ncbi:phage head-tail connector protein [Streptococcus oralis]|jgi:DNA packaging protein, QLRG family|uniref:phage head-tail connector protein n=1 Tax=Streptococcus oralis TaxID=1303 RepID=UPI0020610E03|nr:MAG TPA: PORTAL PROTEIN, 15 PROTEIN, HEAD PROTEIN, VIRAL INFECTION, TAILED.2A [Caudoviricetes sp.]DAU10570.1 MAG TPA: PORTAL PROTEIN, 15 PROTEIN, HEAD PROTEIN, VIRAL INFECTION, TAILED.2A [Caudoviricetes sp.]DAX31240.1 MAG TPA: PORTAL PROTEIN, 15 PROTEIN, HEAD PROTEIN, VIRAL INFECTION, TAILED.2A [Caudoviricetes sp.]